VHDIDTCTKNKLVTRTDGHGKLFCPFGLCLMRGGRYSDVPIGWFRVPGVKPHGK
jgi:hypothetical protein